MRRHKNGVKDRGIKRRHAKTASTHHQPHGVTLCFVFLADIIRTRFIARASAFKVELGKGCKIYRPKAISAHIRGHKFLVGPTVCYVPFRSNHALFRGNGNPESGQERKNQHLRQDSFFVGEGVFYVLRFIRQKQKMSRQKKERATVKSCKTFLNVLCYCPTSLIPSFLFLGNTWSYAGSSRLPPRFVLSIFIAILVQHSRIPTSPIICQTVNILPIALQQYILVLWNFLMPSIGSKASYRGVHVQIKMRYFLHGKHTVRASSVKKNVLC